MGLDGEALKSSENTDQISVKYTAQMIWKR